MATKTKTKTTRYIVYVGDGDIPGFLDMLRYDAAVVETWGRLPELSDTLSRRRGGFQVTLRSERFTPDRWASFDLHPRVTD